MSTTDVSIKSKQVDVQTASQISGCDTRIGNVLGGGKAGDSTIINPQPEDKKIARQNDIRNLAENYKVSVNDIHNFIQKAFGYSAKEFYELNENKYNTISVRTLPTILDLLQRKHSSRSIQERLDKFGERFAEMIQNGNTVEEATNFFEHFEDNGLFQILKIQFPSELKQYKNAKDVPQNVLESCMQKFFIKFKQNEGKNNQNNIGKTLTIFKNLLSRTSDEDYKVLLNAFIKVASKENEKFAGIIATIKEFKDPDVFKKFLNDELPAICAKYNLDVEKTQQIFRSLAKTAKETGLESREFMNKVLDLINPDNVYNKLVEKQKNGEELSKEESEYITNYGEFKRIEAKKKSGEALTEEENKFLADFEARKKQIEGAFVAALVGENPNDAKKLFEAAAEYGISKEDIIQQIIEFSKNYDDYKVDTNILDEATGGAYSQALAQSNNIENSSAENSYGLSQRVSVEIFSQSADNLPILRAQVVEEKEEPLTVVQNKVIKTETAKLTSYDDIKNIITGKRKIFSSAERQSAIAKYKLLNVAMQGALLQQSIGKFFNDLIENTKTSTLENLLAVGWKGRSVSITDQVKEIIEERNEDIHKNDKKEAV